jgi:hypothetical protein
LILFIDRRVPKRGKAWRILQEGHEVREMGEGEERGRGWEQENMLAGDLGLLCRATAVAAAAAATG